MDIKESRLYKDFERSYCRAADKETHMALALPLIEAHHEEYEKACAQKEAMEKELRAAERKVSSIKSKMKQFDNVGTDIFNVHYMEYAKQLLVGKNLLLVPRDMFVNEVEGATSICATCRVDMFVYDPKRTGSRVCINTSNTIHFDEIVEFLDNDKATTYINKAYKDLEGVMQSMLTTFGGGNENA